MRWLFIIMLLAASASGTAHGQAFDLEDESWEGLSALRDLAKALGMEVLPQDDLAWDDIEKNDVVIILYPTARLEAAHVTTFLRNGHDLVIADELGSAEEAFGRLGLTRMASSGRASEFYQGRVEIPIARPWKSDHPLTKGVSKLYTNQPSIFRSVEKGRILAFSDDEVVVVADNYGLGRFTAISDSSIFINRMLEFEQNREFVANLLVHMSRDRPSEARLVIIAGDTELLGMPTRKYRTGSLREQINTWFDEKNDYLLTRGGVRVLSVLLLLGLAVVLLWALPISHLVPATPTWQHKHRAKDIHSTLEELARNPSNANTVVAAAMLKQQLITRLEEYFGTVAPLSQAPNTFSRVLSQRIGPEAGRRYEALHLALRDIPEVAQAQAHWNRVTITPARLHSLVNQVRDFERIINKETQYGTSIHRT